jgi:hypothetical protein
MLDDGLKLQVVPAGGVTHESVAVSPPACGGATTAKFVEVEVALVDGDEKLTAGALGGVIVQACSVTVLPWLIWFVPVTVTLAG